MPRDRLGLYLHLVWATWDRLPLIAAQIERRLYRNIDSQAQAMDCSVLALNGMPDHVHLLVRFPATIAVADLVKQVKGVSSQFVGATLTPGTFFKWQGSYGAFTVSRWDVDKIKGYIDRQKDHHASGSVIPEFEETLQEKAGDDG